MKHVYLHFPFCLKKCHYCDFSSVACPSDEIPHEGYVSAALREIQRCPPLSRPPDTLPPRGGGDILETIFLGGGTPSLMRPGDVEQIFNALQKKYSFASNIEISLEVNPGSIPVKRLKDFQIAGVNRFSVGVQSFDDANLKWFGRIHSAEEGKQMVRAAQALPGCRVNLDLIYGFPNQTVEDWRKNLETAIELGVKHLSAYALTMPENGRGDPCGRPQKGQTQGLPLHESNGVDVAADMQELTYEFMERVGLPAYEISNFAYPGEESRHNLGYWRYEDFLGIGAGAVSQGTGIRGQGSVGENPCIRSSDFVTRKTNFKTPVDYMRAVISGEKYFDEELIDEPTAQFEFMMMGLRTREGVSEKRFEDRFGKKMFSVYANAINKTSQNGLLQIQTDLVGVRSISPTQRGMCLNNQLVGEFGPVISRTQV